MNILLPTDFSENSKNAAIYALKFFEKVPCTFHLLHALSFSSEDSNMKEMNLPPEFYANFEQFLSLLNEEKVNPQHEFKFMFKTKYLIDAVREQVLEKKIDLIIMGTKGISNDEGSVIGKNTSDIMMKVKCPVLAISETAEFKEYREILFPTDYKIQYSGEMLDILLNMASMSNASVKIMELFESNATPSFEQRENKSSLQNYLAARTPVLPYNQEGKEEKNSFYTSKNFSADMIALAAKNLNICQKLLLPGQNHQIPFIEKIPLLMLH
ncbi:MAG TPA: universal stress protein [Flavobacteriaceae bacterium]|nr:universal stress protein [Flavobacteriaceae bacterium]